MRGVADEYNFSPLQSVDYGHTILDGTLPSISYYFHDKSFEKFKSELQALDEEGRKLLKDILTEKYQPKEPPQDVLNFLNNSGLEITKEIAKKLFIFLDLTAGKDDRDIHTGVNMNMFDQDFMLAFFGARQTAIIVEKYPEKKGENDFITFRGVPYADLSNNHLKKTTGAPEEEIYKFNYDDNPDAKKLIANSYVNVLQAAKDFLKEDDGGLFQEFQKLEKKLELSFSDVVLTEQDLLQIQKAAVTVKIAMAEKAKITPMLNVPGLFAGDAWKDKFKQDNYFTGVVEDVLKDMKPEHRPDKVVVNQGGVVVLSVDSLTSSITKGESAKSYDPYIVNEKSHWDTLVNSLGLQNLALDKCAANFPMRGLKSGVFSVSSGGKASTNAKTAEECLNGVINKYYVGKFALVKIYVGEECVGKTEFDKKQRCSASSLFYRSKQIKQSESPPQASAQAPAQAEAQPPAPAEASAGAGAQPLAQAGEVVVEETQIPATTCCCCGFQWLVESIQNWSISCNSR